MSESKRRDARPIFRWLAAINFPVFIFMAVTTLRPSLIGFEDDPSYFGAALFLWAGVMFGMIALTGRIDLGLIRQTQIFQCAAKFNRGEITLEEYGSQTKHILSE